MRSSTVILAAVAMLSAMSGGDCTLNDLLDSAAQTATIAGKTAQDVGASIYEVVSAGIKGADDVVRYGTETLTDAQKKTYEKLHEGHVMFGKLAEERVENLVDYSQQFKTGVSDSVLNGGKALLRTKLDLVKSGVDMAGKAVSGISDTLRAGLKSSVGAVLNSYREVPIVKPLLRLPYKLMKNHLKATSRFAETARTNSKNVLDKMRPDDV